MKYRVSFLRDSVFVLLVVDTLLLFCVFIEWKECKVRIEGIDFFSFFRDSTFIEQKSTRVIQKIVLTLQP